MTTNTHEATQKLLGDPMSVLVGLQRLFAGYRYARQALRGSISRQSRLGLYWMNFFLADVQTGFGAFVAFYLANHGWQKSEVGLALAVGTISGVISHEGRSLMRCHGKERSPRSASG